MKKKQFDIGYVEGRASRNDEVFLLQKELQLLEESNESRRVNVVNEIAKSVAQSNEALARLVISITPKQ